VREGVVHSRCGCQEHHPGENFENVYAIYILQYSVILAFFNTERLIKLDGVVLSKTQILTACTATHNYKIAISNSQSLFSSFGLVGNNVDCPLSGLIV